MKRFSEFVEEIDRGTYPVKAVHTLEKGAWGSQQFKQVHWTHHHTKNPNMAHVDTKHGKHYIHPQGAARILDHHPEVKRLKKEGWTSSERGSGIGIHQNEIDDIVKQHADNYKGRPIEVIKGEDTH